MTELRTLAGLAFEAKKNGDRLKMMAIIETLLVRREESRHVQRVVDALLDPGMVGDDPSVPLILDRLD